MKNAYYSFCWLKMDVDSGLVMTWWQILLTALGVIISLSILIYSVRSVNIIPRRRATLRADLEILKLLEPTSEENYQIVKAYVDSSIRSIYRDARSFKERFKVHNWLLFIMGVAVSIIAVPFTIRLLIDVSPWATLPGYFAMAGLFYIMASFKERRINKLSAYNADKDMISAAVAEFMTRPTDNSYNHKIGDVPKQSAKGLVGGIDIKGAGVITNEIYYPVAMCPLLVSTRPKGILKNVPPSCSILNCTTGGDNRRDCPGFNGSYIWYTTSTGDIASICISPKAKLKNTDGYQYVYP
jgi:hypothetical protein